MSANHNKKTESKYVSCFADSRPDVDITFRDVLLKRPTDHYLVGVDNFSLTNTSLSMIEPMPENSVYHDLIRIKFNPKDTLALTDMPGSADDLNAIFVENGDAVYSGHLMDPTIPGRDFKLSISSTETILSIQQLMRRLGDLAADVNEFMRLGDSWDFETETGGYAPATAENVEHLSFELLPQGQIWVAGTKAFWSCFSIEIPAVRNQHGFYGPPLPRDNIPFTGLRQFLSVNPYTGEAMYDKILTNRYPKRIPTEPDELGTPVDVLQTLAHGFNRRTMQGSDPHYLAMSFANPGNLPNDFNNGDEAISRVVHTVQLRGSVFSSLERRIAIEIGCSLPVTNSPMVDHGKEAPDFVLGRWIWRTDQRVSANAAGGMRRYEGPSPNCVQYQGPQDRILYHELMAQSKIQTLRVRLFARLRTFDELKETWGMRVIELPAVPSDWWHARLHFISRD